MGILFNDMIFVIRKYLEKYGLVNDNDSIRFGNILEFIVNDIYELKVNFFIVNLFVNFLYRNVFDFFRILVFRKFRSFFLDLLRSQNKMGSLFQNILGSLYINSVRILEKFFSLCVNNGIVFDRIGSFYINSYDVFIRILSSRREIVDSF